jgi:hypothetical protein
MSNVETVAVLFELAITAEKAARDFYLGLAVRFSRKRIGEFQTKPAIVFSPAPDSDTWLLLKDLFDRMLTLVGIILF